MAVSNHSDPVGSFPLKELKAETGFSSYVESLEARKDVFSNSDRITKILAELRLFDGPYAHTLPSHCFIIDVLRDGKSDWSCVLRLNISSQPDSSLQSHDSDAEVRAFSCANALKLDQTLRSSMDLCSMRLVFWHIRSERLPSEWIDIVGLRLQVPPSFFELSLQKFDGFQRSDSYIFDSRHFRIGNAAAILLCDDGSSTPTVLIAYREDKTYNTSGLIVEDLLDRDFGTKLPSTDSQGERRAANHSEHRSILIFGHYQRLLLDALELNSGTCFNADTLYLLSVLPLFKLASLQLQVISRISRFNLIDLDAMDPYAPGNIERYSNCYDDLEHKRADLRRAIEDFKDAQQMLTTYIMSRRNTTWLDSNAAQIMKANAEIAIDVAQRRETEIRDYLQIAVSNISIEESRNSIELTNIQIEEGKQVKIFTILAFVYVPLNLATSVFGMNIQQLNQSGRPLWIFITTAIATMALTALVWFCVIQANSVRRWILTCEPTKLPDVEARPKYSIGVRIAMLCYLVLQGRTIWMLKSKIWIHILTNSDRTAAADQKTTFRTAAGHYMSRCVASRHGQEVWLPEYGWDPRYEDRWIR